MSVVEGNLRGGEGGSLRPSTTAFATLSIEVLGLVRSHRGSRAGGPRLLLRTFFLDADTMPPPLEGLLVAHDMFTADSDRCVLRWGGGLLGGWA